VREGTTPEEAHITASTNYFTVVCFHSVVVFVPLAVVLPFPFVILAAPVVLLREWLGIEFLPGV
jgi:hypothetical protein